MTIMKAYSKLVFINIEKPYLIDICALLFSIEKAYEYCVFAAEQDKYRGRFIDFDLLRNEMEQGKLFFNFPIESEGRMRPEHQLIVKRMSKGSPLSIELLFGSIGGLWLLIQLFEKIYNWKLIRKKLELEIGKLEVDKLYLKKQIMLMDLKKQGIIAKEEDVVNLIVPKAIITELRRNPFALKDFAISKIYELSDKNRE